MRALAEHGVRRRTAAHGALTTRLVENHREFFELGQEWNRLLVTSAADNPFLTWQWLYPWWTHLSGTAQLRLITVRRGDDLIAIAPLTLAGGSLPLMSRIEFLGVHDAGSDYLDLIVRRGREPESLEAIARALAAAGHSLRLEHLAPGSIASQLPDHMERAGWTPLEATQEWCPYIPLLGHTWESYLQSCGATHRANFRRRLRALEAHFRVTFEPAGPDDCLTTLDRLAWYHERRWDTHGGSTAFSTIALRAFHADAARRMLERGWLRLYSLCLDGSPVATMYGFFYNRRFYFYQHGFDDAYAKFSVGLVTMGLAIRAAIAEGAIEFDMLYGRESYKRLWATALRPLTRLHVFRPGIAGAIQRRALAARQALASAVRRLDREGDSGAA